MRRSALKIGFKDAALLAVAKQVALWQTVIGERVARTGYSPGSPDFAEFLVTAYNESCKALRLVAPRQASEVTVYDLREIFEFGRSMVDADDLVVGLDAGPQNYIGDFNKNCFEVHCLFTRSAPATRHLDRWNAAYHVGERLVQVDVPERSLPVHRFRDPSRLAFAPSARLGFAAALEICAQYMVKQLRLNAGSDGEQLELADSYIRRLSAASAPLRILETHFPILGASLQPYAATQSRYAEAEIKEIMEQIEPGSYRGLLVALIGEAARMTGFTVNCLMAKTYAALMEPGVGEAEPEVLQEELQGLEFRVRYWAHSGKQAVGRLGDLLREEGVNAGWGLYAFDTLFDAWRRAEIDPRRLRNVAVM